MPILLHSAGPCQAESGLTPHAALNTIEVIVLRSRTEDILLGISLAVGRLTLDQVAEVRILHPQPSPCLSSPTPSKPANLAPRHFDCPEGDGKRLVSLSVSQDNRYRHR